jgi:hypothetical protein
MAQSPDQQPPQGPTPEQQEFMDMIGQQPYAGYLDELQRTITEEAKGDPAKVEELKRDLIKRLVGNFPPLKDAYDKAFPQAQQQDEQEQ